MRLAGWWARPTSSVPESNGDPRCEEGRGSACERESGPLRGHTTKACSYSPMEATGKRACGGARGVLEALQHAWRARAALWRRRGRGWSWNRHNPLRVLHAPRAPCPSPELGSTSAASFCSDLPEQSERAGWRSRGQPFSTKVQLMEQRKLC